MIKMTKAGCAMRKKMLNNVKSGGVFQQESGDKIDEEPVIKILVCAHKEDYVRNDDVFMPIQVGKVISDVDLGFQGDDTGDNISIKNRNYAELTALYWAWKNLKNVDYIGLNHYRRYFYFSSLPLMDHKICPTEEFRNIKNTTFDLNRHLGKYDIILSKPTRFAYPYYLRYCLDGWSHDYRLFKKIIEDLFPEYSYSFCEVMEHRNKISYCNMFITKWEIFDDYCKWLFAILEEAERLKDFSLYPYQDNRICGCVAESLLNVYVEKNKLKIKTYPVIVLRDDIRNKSLLERIVKYFKYNIAFAIGRDWVWWFKSIFR
jgi:hypothetical protein